MIPIGQKKLNRFNDFSLIEKTDINLASSMDRYLEWVSSRGLDSKEYQYEGVEWCMKSEQREKAMGPRGGFLADEMGLGKTITMIGLGFVLPVERTLIVLPSVLVDQWKDQLRKLDGRKILVWHKGIKRDHLLQIPIVITTYGKIGVTKKREVCELHKVQWGRIIFDEAHHVRNRNTGSYMGAKLLQGDAKWMVTGTPIQNRLTDFKSLCAVFGIAASKMGNAQIEEIKKEYVLRRTKESVNLSLPKLEINDVFVDWSDDGEGELANYIHSKIPFLNVERNSSEDNVNIFKSEGHLAMLMKGLQVSAFPALLKEDINSAVERNILDKDHPYNKAVRTSTKLDLILKMILDTKDDGKAKIIFCRFHKEMDYLYQGLREKLIDVVVFDGRVSLALRKHILNEPHHVLIMQIQASSEGFNLQHYSHIYFVSPHWNPALQAQAISRSHRYGQHHHVHIYRFFHKHGTDLYITQIQYYKHTLYF